MLKIFPLNKKLIGFIALLAWATTPSIGQTYCTPDYTTGCIAMDIENVVLMGNTVTLDNSATGCSTDAFGDFTGLVQPDLTRGNQYTISISTNYVLSQFCEVRGWIDYNNDGVFGSSEEILNTNGSGLGTSGTTDFQFTIPTSGGTDGMHRMRIRLVYAATGNIDPCSTEGLGETEDYLVDIQSAAGSNCTGAPIAGTIDGFVGQDTAFVCADNPYSFLVTGASAGNGITYQWQHRVPAGTGSWGDVPNATTENLELAAGALTEPTDFRFKVTCSNSSSNSFSNVVTAVVDTIPNHCYCQPSATNSSKFINDFSTTGGVANISNLGSGFSPNGYGDFMNLVVSQYPNQSIQFNAVYDANNDYGLKAWVDWNQDGQFESSELVYQTTAFNGSIIGNITVPSNATQGITRMRIGISSQSLAGPNSPCETGFAFGEFEDYAFEVLPLTACSGAVTAGSLPATDTVCSGQIYHLEAIGATSSIGVSGLIGQWQYREPAGTGTWTDIVGATEPSAVFSPMPNVPVDIRFIYACGNNSDTSNIMTTVLNDPNECYCIPEGTDPNKYINSFVTDDGVQNIDNQNSGFSPNGYGSFLNDTVTQQRGHSFNFTAKIKGGTAGFKIWIDYDHDGSFNFTDEVAYVSSLVGHDTLHQGTIIIPVEATDGVTRMRIGSDWSASDGPATPCEVNDNMGEFEDYTIKILPCDTPFVDLGPDTAFCEGVPYLLGTGNTQSGNLYEWNTGASSPAINVTESGTYSVTVFDQFGCPNSDTVEIEVYPLPSADGIVIDVIDPLTFQFRADNATNADSFIWDFGDGAQSTDVEPIHNYAQAGSYTVTLIMENDCGSDTIVRSFQTNSVGIGDISHEKEEVKVYPNPARDYLVIENWRTVEMKSITVYNLLGQKVLNQPLSGQGHYYQLDTKSLTPANYLVKIMFDDGSEQTRQITLVK